MNGATAGPGGLSSLSWDLKNSDKWEYVLETTDPLESLNVDGEDSNGMDDR